jgi:hypothetical protein
MEEVLANPPPPAFGKVREFCTFDPGAVPESVIDVMILPETARGGKRISAAVDSSF